MWCNDEKKTEIKTKPIILFAIICWTKKWKQTLETNSWFYLKNIAFFIIRKIDTNQEWMKLFAHVATRLVKKTRNNKHRKMNEKKTTIDFLFFFLFWWKKISTGFQQKLDETTMFLLLLFCWKFRKKKTKKT